MGVGLSGQADQEAVGLDAGQAVSQEFLSAERVMDIAQRQIATGPAIAAVFDGRVAAGEAWAFERQAAMVGEQRAVAGQAGGGGSGGGRWGVGARG